MAKKKNQYPLFIVLAIVLTVFSLGLTVSGQAIEVTSNTQKMPYAEGYVPGQLLVGMEEPIALDNIPNSTYESMFPGVEIISIRDLTDVSAILPAGTNNNPSSVEPEVYSGRQILLVELASGSEVDMREAITTLESNPLVAYAEPNLIGSACSIPRKEPNDPYFLSGDLWGLEQIQAPEAWYLCTGSDFDPVTGRYGVLVGDMDSGIYEHPDLIGNYDISLGYNFLYDNEEWGYDNSDPIDDYGHGSHVIGTIGAVGDNDEGVVGLNWGVTVVPLKIWNNDGYGSEAELISAIRYADSLGIEILNLSGRWNKQWWPDTHFRCMRDTIKAYRGLLVAAAGNEATDNDDDFYYSPPNNAWGDFRAYPASFDLPNIISVAATDPEDELCFVPGHWFFGGWGSNWGSTTVDLAAPGTGIYSTTFSLYWDWNEFDWLPEPVYESWAGTSMATPHVSGTAALLKAYGLELGLDLSPAEIKDAILSSVDHCQNLEGLVLTEGRLNTYEALMSITTTDIKITYDANGGMGAPGFQTEEPNVSFSLSLVEPNRGYCNFLGWATSPTATTATYQPGATAVFSANTTLYAVWQGIDFVDVYPVELFDQWSNPGYGIGFELIALNLEPGTYGMFAELSYMKGIIIDELCCSFEVETKGHTSFPFLFDGTAFGNYGSLGCDPGFEYKIMVQVYDDKDSYQNILYGALYRDIILPL